MIMYDASDSEAIARIAGRIHTAGDHAAPFEARESARESPSGTACNGHAHHAAQARRVCRVRAARGQQLQSLCTALQVDFVVGTSAKLYLEVSHHQGLKAHAVGVRKCARRKEREPTCRAAT